MLVSRLKNDRFDDGDIFVVVVGFNYLKLKNSDTSRDSQKKFNDLKTSKQGLSLLSKNN